MSKLFRIGLPFGSALACLAVFASSSWALTVQNHGRCGQNSGITRERFEADVLKFAPKPDYVLIYIGMNDVINDRFFTPLDKYLENVKWMIDQSRKAKITPVVCTMHHVVEEKVYAHHAREKFAPETVNGKMDRYNAALKKLAAELAIGVADFGAVTDRTPQPEFLSEDGVHLTASGNRLLAKTFLGVIGSRLRGDETIVCVGDSLTFGYQNKGSGTAEGETYPAMLKQLATPSKPASAADAGPKQAPPGPRLVSKEVFLRHESGRPHATGFVLYADKSKPILMHCSGWEDYSDGYDNYAIRMSRDNGRTWSEPEVRWKSSVVPAGRIRYAEPTALFDDDHEKLIVLVDKYLYPKDRLNVDAEYSLELSAYDPASGKWTEPRVLSFPGQRTPAVSFSFPIKTKQGHLLFPAMRQVRDAGGKAVHYKNCWAPVDEMMTVIGQWDSQGSLSWRLGNPLQIAPETSSRGLDENALAELADGRIAAICRGDNSMFPDKPGYKWLSFSRDDGQSWSAPVPLPATGGGPIESGSNGSALFRSIRSGRLYWLGNLAIRGERPNGNRPRSPLCLVEVQEEPLALKRETIFVVDERSGSDSPAVQLSNFRFYQDRETGDLVIFLTRYAERSEQQWMLADYYRYRVALPGN